jgi:hypothetical protein
MRFINYKVIKSFVTYNTMGKNMHEILKFVYFMSIFLFIFLDSMNINGKPFFYFFISYAIYYPNLIIFIYSLFSLKQVVIMNVQIIMNVKKSVVQLLLNRGVYFVNVNVLKLIYNKSYVIPNECMADSTIFHDSCSKLTIQG